MTPRTIVRHAIVLPFQADIRGDPYLRQWFSAANQLRMGTRLFKAGWFALARR
jgi:hypothetical protein